MLFPDVTEILNDPEVGGGTPFTVKRVLNTRVLGGVTQTDTIYHLTGNLQPAAKSIRESTTEDLLEESITVWAKFDFQTGANSGATFAGPDEIIYDGSVWRVTSVDNWSDWGYTKATATKVMDTYPTPAPPEPDETEGDTDGMVSDGI